MSAKPKTSIETPSLVVRPISVGAVNWIGISTLYVKEVMRFLKVAYRSFRSEECSARGVRKVTTGITGLWQPSVHSDVAF